MVVGEIFLFIFCNEFPEEDYQSVIETSPKLKLLWSTTVKRYICPRTWDFLSVNVTVYIIQRNSRWVGYTEQTPFLQPSNNLKLGEILYVPEASYLMGFTVYAVQTKMRCRFVMQAVAASLTDRWSMLSSASRLIPGTCSEQRELF